MPTRDNLPEDAPTLRRVVRDGVALSMLFALGTEESAGGIARNFAERLTKTLSLDLLYLHLPASAGREAVELARGDHRAVTVPEVRRIAESVTPYLPTDGTGPTPTIPDPLGEATLRIAVLRLGPTGDLGRMVVGSQRPDFPTEAERLLLEIGSHQAALAIQRKGFEQSLTDQREWFRVALASIGDAVITTDTEGRVTSMNQVAEALTGWRQGDALGKPLLAVFEIINEQSRQVENPVQKVLAEGRIVGLANHTVLIARDGTERPIDDSAAPIRDSQGNILGVILVFHDVTESRAAEQAVRASEQQFQSFMRHSPATAYIKDGEGRYLFVNRLLEQHFNRPLSEWVGKTDFDLFPPAEAGQYRANDESVLASRSTTQFVETATQADGLHYYLSYKFPLQGRDGRWLLAGMSVEITEQKKTEGALRESEAQFRQLADAMPQIVWATGTDGVIDYYNRRWYDLTGSSFGEGNKGWREVIHPDDMPLASEQWARCLPSGTPFEMELRLRDRRNGDYRWHLMRTIPVPAHEGGAARWYGTATDIDEQKRAGEAARFLAEASAALAGLVDYESTLQRVANLAIPHFADWCAVDLASTDGSLRRLAVAHRNPERVRLAQELFHRYPPDPDARGGIGYVFRTGKPDIIEHLTDEMLAKGARDPDHLRLIRQLGLRSYICVPLVVVGKTFGVITFATAESSRNYTRSDLSLAQDLCHRAAIAIDNANLYRALREEDRRKTEFLATLAHELRNPLAPLRNGLQVMKLARSDSGALEQSRTMMERQLQQLVRLVDDLLDISCISQDKIELRKERIELSAVVSMALESCAPAIEQQEHELTVTLPEEAVYVDADKTRLAQVLCNLLSNAIKYTDRGGRIGLTVERQGSEVAVRVKDTGVGIPPPLLPRIFEMFMQVDRSLEKSHGGLGIGLTLVKRLAEMHGGSVEAHSEGHGKGSEFILRLPVARSRMHEPNEKDGRDKAGPTARRRILVVDDNVDAAGSLALMLQIMGNEVRTAHDGLTAVTTAALFRPDMIFLDIGMPKLNGYDAARRIRLEPWGQNVVLVALTGWGQEEDRRRSREAGFNHHLVKPVEPGSLEKLLAQMQATTA